jgi:ferric-dicitrate binding protein FerR (iron transport regulator)
MKSHPTGKQLIDRALNGAAPEEVQNHIDQCARCQNRLERYEGFMQPSDNSKIEPSAAVWQRLERTLREKQVEAQPARGSRRLRWTLAIAGPAMAAAVVVFGIVFNPLQPVVEKEFFTVAQQGGDVSLDGNKEKPVLKSGTAINTGTGGHVVLCDGKTVTLTLGSDAVFIIKRSQYDRNGKRYLFDLELQKGTLHARFDHDKQHFAYTITTPDARIHSIGTEFLLSVEENASELYLTEGSVTLDAMKGDSSVKAEAGNKYNISENIAEHAMNDTDTRTVQRFLKTPQRPLSELHRASSEERLETAPVKNTQLETSGKTEQFRKREKKEHSEKNREDFTVRERRELQKKDGTVPEREDRDGEQRFKPPQHRERDSEGPRRPAKLPAVVLRNRDNHVNCR